MTKAYSLQTSR